jgi:hypothetical protein
MNNLKWQEAQYKIIIIGDSIWNKRIYKLHLHILILKIFIEFTAVAIMTDI